MASEKTAREKMHICIKGLFVAYALLTEFINPIDPGIYEGIAGYIKASILAVFDINNFRFFLVSLVVSAFFFLPFGIEENEKKEVKGAMLLSCFFSFCVLIGKGCAQFTAITPIFSNITNIAKFAIAFVGFTILFERLLLIVFFWLKRTKENETGGVTGFFGTGAFLKAFLILLAAYLPFVFLSYPGNMCWDAAGQIEQVIIEEGYSLHHPIVHTLIMGYVIKFGYLVAGSYNVGLFVYVLLQTVVLSAALAFSVRELSKRKIAPKFLWILMGFYVITPVFSNITSTAVKDVPFCAAVVVFMVLFVRVAEEENVTPKTWICLALAQAGVILLRNNGLPMIVLTDVGCIIYFLVARRKKSAGKLAIFGSVSIIVSELLVLILVAVLHAKAGSKGEMLSVPFQQTARYVLEYGNELSSDERAAIEKVLGNVENLAASYDPRYADPVKMHFVIESETSDILRYFAVWAGGFFKHPSVYFDAFFVHVYGWFDPMVDNAIRYEMDYSEGVFTRSNVSEENAKLLIAFYNFEDAVAPLGLLQNVALSVWALFILAFVERNLKMGGKYRIINLPLWISLLVCMASPCFTWHPRYGFPILFTIPFLWGIVISGNSKRND